MTGTTTCLRTADGERLHAVVLPGGPDWVVLAHGFSGSTRSRPCAASPSG